MLCAVVKDTPVEIQQAITLVFSLGLPCRFGPSRARTDQHKSSIAPQIDNDGATFRLLNLYRLQCYRGIKLIACDTGHQICSMHVYRFTLAAP